MTTSGHAQTDAARLAAWLAEWHLAMALEDGDEAGFSAPSVAGGRSTQDPGAQAWVYRRKSKSDLLRPGDVRLLRPGVTMASHARPLYVLLIEETPQEHWRVAPFGRFSVPAVPGEWATGLKQEPLKVLCFWNARSLDRLVLRQSWPALRVSAATLRLVLELDRAWRVGFPPGPPRRGYYGPPLWHPADPRHVYLAEEREALRPTAPHDSLEAGDYTIREAALEKAAENAGEDDL